jgi:hypothetical protein
MSCRKIILEMWRDDFFKEWDKVEHDFETKVV